MNAVAAMKPVRDLLREHVEELVDRFAIYDTEGNPLRESIKVSMLARIERHEKIIAALDVAIAEGKQEQKEVAQ